jgi:peptidoglycan/xylan/chitin deacetylase (PgdA/CDA1 family)
VERRKAPLRILEDFLVLVIAFQLLLLIVNGINHANPILGLRLEGQLIGRLFGGDFQGQTDAAIELHENRPLVVRVADQNSTITLRQLGVRVNADQTNHALVSFGRTANLPADLMDQDLAALGLRNMMVGNPNFDTNLAASYIATLDKKIDTAPQNAYFAFDGKVATVHADKDGRAIDSDAALRLLKESHPETETHVTLSTKPVPALVTVGQLNTHLEEVRRISDKPLTIVAGGSKVTLSQEQLVGFVIPKVIPDEKNAKKTAVQLTFDEAKLNAIVDEVLSKVVTSAQPTIVSGGVVIQQGKPGVQAQDDNSLGRVITALVQRQTGSSDVDEVQIPLVTIDPPVEQRQSPVTNNRTGTGSVRLTFDDGPGAYTEQILTILNRYNVHATFYVIGRNVERYPGTVRRIVNEGHRVGNHSYTHSNLTLLSGAGVEQELMNTQTAVRQASGVTPAGFRPPYGAVNGTVRNVVADLGMSVDMWSVDPRDWAQPGSSVITQRVLSATGPGAVVLLHVLHAQTVDALPSIIQGIRAQGFTLE